MYKYHYRLQFIWIGLKYPLNLSLSWWTNLHQLWLCILWKFYTKSRNRVFLFVCFFFICFAFFKNCCLINIPLWLHHQYSAHLLAVHSSNNSLRVIIYFSSFMTDWWGNILQPSNLGMQHHCSETNSGKLSRVSSSANQRLHSGLWSNFVLLLWVQLRCLALRVKEPNHLWHSLKNNKPLRLTVQVWRKTSNFHNKIAEAVKGEYLRFKNYRVQLNSSWKTAKNNFLDFVVALDTLANLLL